jgi:single-strand DNA-binding protein
MQNYATATIEGFVTHNPQLKKTKTGKSVCTFSLAVNHFTRENSEPRVSYVDVETWDKIAEMCSKNISRGKRVIVIGGLRQDRWEGKDGKAQSRIKIIGNEVRFLEKQLKKDVQEQSA